MTAPLLEIRHLQLIHTLAQTNRVADAAEQLGVTASALSHRIREAERRLDVVLYTRVSKRLRMTPAAEHLAQVAQRILAELERAEEDVRRLNRGTRHVVRIAVEFYSSYHWLPSFLRFLRAGLPGVDLQVTAAAARNTQTALTNREVDIAIVSGQLAHSGAHLLHLFDDELLFIMAPDHRLAGRHSIEGPDIVGEDFITYTKVPEPDREFAMLFRPTGCYPNWTETVELPEAIVELVASGLGTSILAGWAVQNAIDNGRIVAARVGRDGLSIPWYAAVRPEVGKEEAARQVATLLAAWCGETKGFKEKGATL
jgi:LysR family transcriptional regulator for metE and metH